MNRDQSPLRTQREAASYLRVSERTLERWRVEGQGLAFRKIGRRVVYHDDDLNAFANANVFENTAQAEASRHD